jgi:hypothetical protein
MMPGRALNQLDATFSRLDSPDLVILVYLLYNKGDGFTQGLESVAKSLVLVKAVEDLALELLHRANHHFLETVDFCVGISQTVVASIHIISQRMRESLKTINFERS